jgi:hypothetical protein
MTILDPKPSHVCRHDYAWRQASWADLTTVLEDLEAEGWEIFTVCAIGGSVFVHVVIRRQVREVMN